MTNSRRILLSAAIFFVVSLCWNSLFFWSDVPLVIWLLVAFVLGSIPVGLLWNLAARSGRRFLLSAALIPVAILCYWPLLFFCGSVLRGGAHFTGPEAITPLTGSACGILQ